MYSLFERLKGKRSVMRNSYYKKVQQLATNVSSKEDEISYLRELASMTMELSHEPRMRKIEQRWRDVNALRTPDRPPVWCKPVACWNEIISADNLVCKETPNSNLELYFHKIMMKRDIDDDSPVTPYFKLGMHYDVTPSNTWGLDIVHEASEDEGGAWKYKPSLETYEDFDKLQIPQYRYNKESTEEEVDLFAEILGDIMPVKLAPFIGYTSNATLAYPATDLRGMEALMMDTILEPERVHQLINVIFQGTMNLLDEVEATGNIVPNTDEPMFLSDPLRPEPADGKYTLKDCWMAGNSQELDQVSPDMFEEFLLNYQKKIFERFGAVSYGCCENLTQKLDPVLAIPNLKIMVCSDWTDTELLIEKVNKKHCIMWRHLASDIVVSSDTAFMKGKIEREAAMLKGSSYQAILRELQTLMGNKDRLYEWADITKEAVSR